jgi:hypothetical protein
MENKAAQPQAYGYSPESEQAREYLKGFHDDTERRMKAGIKPTEPKAEKAEKAAKAEKPKPEPKAESIPPTEVTSGIPTSRAQFLAQQAKAQQAEPQQTDIEDSLPRAGGDDDEDDEPSQFKRRA